MIGWGNQTKGKVEIAGMIARSGNWLGNILHWNKDEGFPTSQPLFRYVKVPESNDSLICYVSARSDKQLQLAL